ncbi:MAG: hypothetical protein JOZ18_01785, partial [Chloroflexi bacterium]|nr:hypothetical protein [Chloroflexota bacterium]
MHEEIRIEGHICEAQQIDPTGHDIRVTVIQGGLSKNGYAYNEAMLQAIAQKLEGAHAYADHARSAADNTVRSVRDVVGFYHDTEYIPPRQGAAGRVDATLHIMEAAEWLWSLIKEACALDRPELIGLSIDIFGQWQLNETTRAKEVTSVVALNSCDIVTRPSAGGTFRRILHDTSPQGEYAMPEPLNVSEQPVLPQPDLQEQQRILEQQRLQVEQLMAQTRL